MRTELANRMRGMESNALATSMVLVCERRDPSAAMLSRNEFRRELRQRLPQAIKELEHANIAQVFDHPAGGIGLGGQGGLVALFCKEGGLQLDQGLLAIIWFIAFEALGQQADGGGELLGLDAQLPEGAGTLQGAGRPGGLGERWGERRGVSSVDSHGDANGNEEQKERGGGCRSGGEGLRRDQHRGAERWGGVGLGLDQGLLEQAPIADGPSTAAITAPISGERLDAPAELVGSAADGAIGATGTAMEQQMDRPATAALKQSRVDARLRPDEITTTASDDDDRAMGQRRRRQEARKRQCSGLGHCSRGQAHGLQSKQTGQVVREIHCRR